MNSPAKSPENPENNIAYWKSKALSLEYENKMLHKHVKHMYTQMINQYNEYYSQNNLEEQNDEYFEAETIDPCDDNLKKHVSDHLDDVEESKPPNNDYIKRREDEMKMLYGKDWRKILGMETCVQLNFDLFVEKGKANFWPVLPIKL